MSSPNTDRSARRTLVEMTAALAHSVPGATLRIQTSAGDTLMVSGHHPHAALTCCQFRSALIAPRLIGLPHLHDVITAVDFVGGVIDLGGGLYQRSHPAAPDERWLATTLDQQRITALVAEHPFQLPEDAINVVVRPDHELGVAVVRVAADVGFGCRLDEVAFWLLSTCLTAELLASAGQLQHGAGSHHRDRRHP
jgi:hypothetical protein